MTQSEILKSGLYKLGIDFSDIQIRLLELYISEIELWNSKLKLVSSKGEQLIIRHILDSLSSFTELQKYRFKTAADVGSGAGFPGIPLSLFFPDVEFYLIERSGRRVGFLRNVISLMNLGERVKIIESGLDDVSDRYDLVLFRAFRNIIDFYDDLKKITSSGGIMFAYKGKMENIQSELDHLGDKIKVEISSVTVPFLEEERNFCIFFLK
jgi:16S rRNA (guanine527-N7)-methyltransferase